MDASKICDRAVVMVRATIGDRLTLPEQTGLYLHCLSWRQ